MSVSALFSGVALVLALTAAASAAPAMPDRAPIKTTKIADAAQVGSTAATGIEDESTSCSKSRKRLWIESEGWVIRKVTTCP